MMKISSCLLFMLCIFGQLANAKMVKLEPTVLKQNAGGQWIFEKIVDVPNATKVELYQRLKKHIRSTVQSSDNVMTFDDVNSETIVTSVNLALPDMGVWAPTKTHQLSFKLTLEFKENKFRIYATSFNYWAVSGQLIGGPLEIFEWNKVYVKHINPKVDEALSSFLGSIESAGKSGGQSDW